jgi:flagellar assembly protein FliH
MAGASSRVLKKGSLSSAPTAEALIAAARERAGEIRAAAEAEGERLRREASEQLRLARLAAVEAGHAEGMARAAVALVRVAELRDAKVAELDTAVVELALDIARRLVGRELGASPGDVIGVARRALRAAAGLGDVVLRAAPPDLPAVREESGVLARLVERGSLTVVEDATLAAGEVIVESAGGRVDARISAQLDAFRRALLAEGG